MIKEKKEYVNEKYYFLLLKHPNPTSFEAFAQIR